MADEAVRAKPGNVQLFGGLDHLERPHLEGVARNHVVARLEHEHEAIGGHLLVRKPVNDLPGKGEALGADHRIAAGEEDVGALLLLIARCDAAKRKGDVAQQLNVLRQTRDKVRSGERTRSEARRRAILCSNTARSAGERRSVVHANALPNRTVPAKTGCGEYIFRHMQCRTFSNVNTRTGFR